MGQKKRYHVVRKNKADTRALFRALLCGYLLYLAWQLIQSGGSDPSFPPLVAWLLGGLFILAAAGFGWYSWREYRRALAEAVERFLRAQPRDVRAAFVRRYWYADTVEDAARRLGWSVSKTKSVLFRTRNRLRRQLQKEGFL